MLLTLSKSKKILLLLAVCFMFIPIKTDAQRLGILKKVAKYGIDVVIIAYELGVDVWSWATTGTVIINKPGLNKISYGDDERWFENRIELKLTWGHTHSYFLSKDGEHWRGPYKVRPSWWEAIVENHR